MCTPRLQGQCERHPADHAPRQVPREPPPSTDTCLAWHKLVGSMGDEPWCKQGTPVLAETWTVSREELSPQHADQAGYTHAPKSADYTCPKVSREITHKACRLHTCPQISREITHEACILHMCPKVSREITHEA